MREDLSRSKAGSYAIIEDRECYLVVEVIERDLEGNVLRKKQNVLASGALEYCQGLVDKWNSGADLALIQAFDAWQRQNGEV